MDFSASDSHPEVRAAIRAICAGFGDVYWRRKDKEGTFPEDFYRAIADGGWLGIATPEEYGGAGLGMSGALAMLQTIAECGGGMNGGTSVKINIFGLNPVIKYGNDEQRSRIIPAIIGGKAKTCFAITEPNVGLNTTQITTRAVREGDRYVVSGAKTWISTAQEADYMLLLARTTPADQVSKPADGLSLFLTPLDRKYVEVREIDRMGRCAVDANQMFFDALPVPVTDRLGEEGKGMRYVFDSMNPERMVVAAEAVGIGRAALRKAARYANERIVFGRPIGQNQGVQHPLAHCLMELEAANLMATKAAELYDRGESCGLEANAAKYLAGEAGYRACETAVLTLGGNGFAKEFDVERYLRDIMVARIAPITSQLIASYVAERALGLPKSY
ncbi:MAG: acyl-CoA/acyl-ACP dehydrogenase [Burkholderiales bacterium]|nr:acyl-CoA/acyl-ACP dehydrogenase [Burkholderiales bacterium]